MALFLCNIFRYIKSSVIHQAVLPQTGFFLPFSRKVFSQKKYRAVLLPGSLRHKTTDVPLPYLLQNHVRLRYIGNSHALPQTIQQKLKKILKQTEKFSKNTLVLAFNYGGKDELVRAFKKLHQDLINKKISLTSISESTICSYLDTSGIPDPDLLIRTGGEMRVSNFLLWQIAYTELYVTDVLWPDFQPCHLVEAIKDYQQRPRRGGK